MNPANPARRPLKVAGAALAGLVTALAVAAPAFACHTIVTSQAACATDGGIEITWTIDNSEDTRSGRSATLTTVEVTPAGTTIDIAPNATLPAGGQLVGHQIVPAGTTSATLHIAARWTTGATYDNTFHAEGLSGLRCARPPATPTVTAKSDCDNLTVTVANPQNGVEVDARLTPGTGKARDVAVAPGGSVNTAFTGTAGLTVTVTIGETSQEFSYTKPDNCAAPSASPSAGAPAGGSGGGGSLPVTGTSAGVAGGLAVALLAIGGVLFYLFRRRRIHFVS